MRTTVLLSALLISACIVPKKKYDALQAELDQTRETMQAVVAERDGTIACAFRTESLIRVDSGVGSELAFSEITRLEAVGAEYEGGPGHHQHRRGRQGHHLLLRRGGGRQPLPASARGGDRPHHHQLAGSLSAPSQRLEDTPSRRARSSSRTAPRQAVFTPTCTPSS